jgi:hypothetical protein
MRPAPNVAAEDLAEIFSDQEICSPLRDGGDVTTATGDR